MQMTSPDLSGPPRGDSAPKNATPREKAIPRRVGSKIRLSPNKWLLRIFRGYDAQGKRIYFSETFHGGSKEADKRLTELAN